MRISRTGSRADHGTYEIACESSFASWCYDDKDVGIHASHVRDFDTPARHNYTISLSCGEVADLVAEVSKGLDSDARAAIAEAFAPHLAALLQIASVAAAAKKK